MSKFISIISLFATAALGVSATYADGVYQIPNGNADMEWTNDNEPGGGLHSFYNASLGSGVLLSTGKKTAISQTTKVAGRTGNAVQLVSKSVMGIAKANGNLTTGNIFMGSTTPTNKANHNETRRSLGADGSLEFAGLPDSLEFYAKYTRGEKGDYNGNVNAFLHGDIDFADPAPDGFPTKEDYVVAFLEFPITPCDDWTRFSSAFEYYTPAKVDMATDTRYMLMNMTTNPIPGSTANDKLIVDDIRFIYNSKLNSLTYDGVDLLGGNKDAYKLSVDGEYDASKLAYEADGRGASVVSAYDEASKALTITVKGNDVAVDANNFHTYEVVFVSENPDTIQPVIPENPDTIQPVIPENPDTIQPVIPENPDTIQPVIPENPDTIQPVIPENPDTIQPIVPENPDTLQPVIPDTTPVTPVIPGGNGAKLLRTVVYTDDLVINISGDDMQPQTQDITVAYYDNGMATLSIMNFIMGEGEDGMLVGDIVLDSVPYTESDSVRMSILKNIFITSDNPDAMGNALPEIPVEIKSATSSINYDKLTAVIGIDLEDMYVTVNFGFSDKKNTGEVENGDSDNGDKKEDFVIDNYFATVNGAFLSTHNGMTLLSYANDKMKLTLVDMTVDLGDGDIVIGDVEVEVPATKSEMFYFEGEDTVKIKTDDIYEIGNQTDFARVKVSDGRSKLSMTKVFYEMEVELIDLGVTFTINFGDSLNSVKEIPSLTDNLDDTRVYTINGTYLGDHIDINRLPVGIYIKKGKKFVVSSK